MSRLVIMTNPNDKLRTLSEPVTLDEISSPEFQLWLEDLTETMHIADGVGLAAPQVGINKRVFVGMIEEQAQVVINPIISNHSFRKINSEEGCLSVPDVWGIVRRHRRVTLTFLDRNGKEQTKKLSGLDAIMAQHETDHLNGILFIDKLIRSTSSPATL